MKEREKRVIYRLLKALQAGAQINKYYTCFPRSAPYYPKVH